VERGSCGWWLWDKVGRSVGASQPEAVFTLSREVSYLPQHHKEFKPQILGGTNQFWAFKLHKADFPRDCISSSSASLTSPTESSIPVSCIVKELFFSSNFSLFPSFLHNPYLISFYSWQANHSPSLIQLPARNPQNTINRILQRSLGHQQKQASLSRLQFMNKCKIQTSKPNFISSDSESHHSGKLPCALIPY
jgi:hypothetical protein